MVRSRVQGPESDRKRERGSRSVRSVVRFARERETIEEEKREEGRPQGEVQVDDEQGDSKAENDTSKQEEESQPPSTTTILLPPPAEARKALTNTQP